MGQFRPLTFEQWREHGMANTPPDELVDCPECSGSKFTECCECGNDRECDNCDENGKVEFSELSGSDKLLMFSLGRYRTAVLEDGKAWANWHGRDPAIDLFKAGFRVYTMVATRSLHIAGGAA